MTQHENNAKLGGLLTTRNMTRISLLSMMGAVLTIFNWSNVPGFPPFLSLDIGDVPSVVGTLAMGPWAGVLIQLLGNIVKVVVSTSTMGIGELANFLIGTSYILPFALAYHLFSKTKVRFIVAAIFGTIGMMIMGAIGNYFIFLPLYAHFMFNGMEPIISFAATVTPVLGLINENWVITDVWSLIIIGITPFNMLKGFITSLVAFFVYRAIKPILLRT